MIFNQTIRVVFSTFLAILFFGYLIDMINSLRIAKDIETKKEYIGKVVPSIGCIIFIVGLWTPFRVLNICLFVVGSVNLIIGRTLYEQVVFGYHGNKKNKIDNK